MLEVRTDHTGSLKRSADVLLELYRSSCLPHTPRCGVYVVSDNLEPAFAMLTAMSQNNSESTDIVYALHSTHRIGRVH